VLGTLARRVTTLAAVLFLALGAVMFVAPHWAARSFPWKVSPFLAMTIGAWYLGSAVFALFSVRDGRWANIYAALLYVWLFGLFESLVVAADTGVLDLGKPLTWPYFAALAAGLVAAAAGIVELVRTRPPLAAPGPFTPAVFRIASAAFVVATALLALPLLDGYQNPPSIWPGPLTLASARSFAAFFGALSLSAIAVALSRPLAPVLTFLRGGIVLNVIILVAAAVFIGKFHFEAHPGQFLYVGLYVVVLVGTAWMLAYARNGQEPEPEATPSLHA
jgi:hypothetical protein